MNMSKKLKNSRMNELHGNYETNLWTKMDPGLNDRTSEREKTETNISQDESDSSFIGVSCLQSPLNGGASRSAMDLSFHPSRSDPSKTIFEDADYFSRNYSYKLMPITFEAVNETIIHMEHNYCNFGSSAGENLNETIHDEEEERNYKRRKSKSSCGGFLGSDYEAEEKESASLREGFATNPKLDEDYSLPMQPLDLSLPVFHDQKTDKMLKENQSNIPKTKPEPRANPDLIQFNLCESNKENVTSSARKIEVTISRPGQKEYYQPCEAFLNDVARISPDLIKNDCYEIEIIDRTGQDLEKEKHRMYYIVSESTWQRFESSAERIILTNDFNIGEPVRHNEKLEKPTYLIFDRYSLTESLAKMCDKKGGHFEYTCVEESVTNVEETRREVQDCGNGFAVGRIGVEGESRKSCDEGKGDAGKRPIVREGESVKKEPDSAAVPETEETKSETEEKVCDKSRGGDAVKRETSPMLTEPKVPIELNRDRVMEESEKTEETGESELKRTSDDKEDAAMKGGLDEGGVGREKSEIGKRNKNNKERATLDAVDNAAKKKRKLSDLPGGGKTFGQFLVSSKRVTRSGRSLVREEPPVTTGKGKRSGSGKRGRGKGARTKGKGTGSAAIAAEGKSNRRERDSATAKTDRRKQSAEVKARRREENSNSGKRETRSTTRRKAAENVRRSRRRTRETDKVGGSSANLCRNRGRRR